jgi:uncharacterized protein YjiS (DUF1127 family)
VLRANLRKMNTMNPIKAFGSFLADRRTSSILNSLSDEAKKDIGWKWTASRRAPVARTSVNWDLI